LIMGSHCNTIHTAPGIQSHMRPPRAYSNLAPKIAFTLRYVICVRPKTLCFSTPYPTLFPRCFHAGDQNEVDDFQLRTSPIFIAAWDSVASDTSPVPRKSSA
jgi:hypothetical protein